VHAQPGPGRAHDGEGVRGRWSDEGLPDSLGAGSGCRQLAIREAAHPSRAAREAAPAAAAFPPLEVAWILAWWWSDGTDMVCSLARKAARPPEGGVKFIVPNWERDWLPICVTSED
jgi:hypothetical protein